MNWAWIRGHIGVHVAFPFPADDVVEDDFAQIAQNIIFAAEAENYIARDRPNDAACRRIDLNDFQYIHTFFSPQCQSKLKKFQHARKAKA